MHPLLSAEGSISRLLLVFNQDNPGCPCNLFSYEEISAYIHRVAEAFGPAVEYVIFTNCSSKVRGGEEATESFDKQIEEIFGEMELHYDFRIVPSRIFYNKLPFASIVGIETQFMNLATTVQDYVNVFTSGEDIILQKPIYTNQQNSLELVDLCINDELALDDARIKMRPGRINIEGGQSFFGKFGNGLNQKYFMVVDERAFSPENLMYTDKDELLSIIREDFCVDMVVPVRSGELSTVTGGAAFFHLDMYVMPAGKKGNQQLVYVAELDTQFLEQPDRYQPLGRALDEVAAFFSSYSENGLSFAVRRLKTPLLYKASVHFSPSYLNAFVEHTLDQRKVYIPDYADDANTESSWLLAVSRSSRNKLAAWSAGSDVFSLFSDEDSRTRFIRQLEAYQLDIAAELGKEFDQVIPIKGKYFKHVDDLQGSLHCWMKPLLRTMDL